MKKTLLTAVLALTFSLLSAVDAHCQYSQITDQVFRSDGEVYFTFTIGGRDEADLLTKIISIDNVNGATVYAYANKKQFEKFLGLGYAYKILPHPGGLPDDSMLREPDPNDAPGTDWNFYPTYDEYVGYMVAFSTNYPEICKLDTIGYSVQNRLLLAVRISDSVYEHQAEPQFLYTSSIHGDETTGYVLMLHLIDHLLSNYGSDPRITDMINHSEIHICPLANPDGTYHGGNNSVYGSQRFNANYIDLNRNYPDPADGPHPDGEDWQPETIAFMTYADSNHFVMGANFHGGAEVFNYPWDTWYKRTADDDWWQFVGREYVDTVYLYSPPSYFSGFNNGISNGYDWYRITGGRQDYMNYWQSCREVTLEISNVKLLPANQLINHWNYNYRSLLNYIDEAGYSTQGIITDSVTGAPLEAKVFIFGHDKDHSEVYSKLPSGYYSRLLNEGSYSISYSCLGYFTKLVTGVNIVSRQQTRLDVQLVPLNIGRTDPEVQRRTMAFPNPADGVFRVIFPVTSDNLTHLEIYNSIGRKVYEAHYPANLASTSIDLSHVSAGLYIIRFSCSSGIFEDRMILR